MVFSTQPAQHLAFLNIFTNKLINLNLEVTPNALNDNLIWLVIDIQCLFFVRYRLEPLNFESGHETLTTVEAKHMGCGLTLS